MLQGTSMGLRKGSVGETLLLALLYLSVAGTSFTTQCDARSSRHVIGSTQLLQALRHPRSTQLRAPKKLQPVKHLGTYTPSDPYYLGTPFYMPPYEDIMDTPSPTSSPQSDPLYCVNPPPPMPPSPGVPAPVIYPPPSLPGYPSPPVVIPSPPGEYTPTPNPPELPPTPPSSQLSPPGFVPGPTVGMPSPPEYVPSPAEIVPSPPEYVPSPPEYVPSPFTVTPSPPEYVPSPFAVTPSPPEYVPSPPTYVPSPPEYVPSPPSYVPSPPEYVPGPPEYEPSPPEYVFEPPVVYPPPTAPPSPPSVTQMWCVAKPTVPDPIIQEAMNYACGSGADCDSIQPNGPCYQPDTLILHASYAFNSYWQRTRGAGGKCDFGGTAILITVDPSFDGCHFITTALQGIDGGE
uniref:Glucan endo-1,3-beta-glucosidase-like protein 3 n=1 Tax=Anthurium amnicola TaxID=1678845 RepID=A0A1D1XT36_9ARAE